MLFLSRRRVSDARRFLTFRFPFSVDWIRRRERERERETTEEDGRFGVPWTLGGVRFVSKSWIKDKNETL